MSGTDHEPVTVLAGIYKQENKNEKQKREKMLGTE
jgi:hypothetical protein